VAVVLAACARTPPEERPALPDETGPPLRQCDRAALRLFGRRGDTSEGRGPGFVPPRLLSSASPDLARGAARGACRGNAEHQVLIGPDGRVERVWPLRLPRCDAPWPALTASLEKAALGARYAPALDGGVAVPVCAVVVTNIDWR
jgi:hypothetical protein